MIGKFFIPLAGMLLLGMQAFAQGKTTVRQADGDYTLSNGVVEAVFSGSGSFDIEKLVLKDRKSVV